MDVYLVFIPGLRGYEDPVIVGVCTTTDEVEKFMKTLKETSPNPHPYHSDKRPYTGGYMVMKTSLNKIVDWEQDETYY